jgi:hypothetical protein
MTKEADMLNVLWQCYDLSHHKLNDMAITRYQCILNDTLNDTLNDIGHEKIIYERWELVKGVKKEKKKERTRKADLFMSGRNLYIGIQTLFDLGWLHNFVMSKAALMSFNFNWSK